MLNSVSHRSGNLRDPLGCVRLIGNTGNIYYDLPTKSSCLVQGTTIMKFGIEMWLCLGSVCALLHFRKEDPHV